MPGVAPPRRAVMASSKSGPSGRRVQLHRALSKLGWGSRAQAWEWICAGEVCVDGRRVTDPLTWEGLNRQVRRMAAAVGCKVRKLVRTAIGGYELGDLAPGACRMLDEADLLKLRRGSGERGASAP